MFPATAAHSDPTGTADRLGSARRPPAHYPRPVTSPAGPPPSGGQPADAAAYADTFAGESPTVAAARHRAEAAVDALGTVPPVEPAVGAVLAVLAAGVGARSVVTIGGGGGVSGLWLLQGMRADGVLTALDSDPTELRAARRTFSDAGLPSGRTRLIFGTLVEVLPRLSPGAYDLVCCAGPPAEYSKQLPGLLDLVRAGGSLVLHGISASAVGDRSQRDPQTVAWRELVRHLKDDEDLVRAVVPVGAGLLVATKRS